MRRNLVSGVFPPMITPFKNEEVDYEGLIGNIKKLNDSNLKGYFILGTNGEFKSLTTEEKLKIIETTVSNSAEDKIVMAGTAAESTKETIDVTLEAAKLGVDQVSILMPHFFRKYIDDEVMINYITDVADASPVPVILYNNPSVAADIMITSKVVKEVASHPNVIGMKDSSKGNYEEYIKISEDEEFYIIAGSASFFYEALKAGAVGGVLSLANVFPNECTELYDLYKNENFTKAEKLNNRLINLNKKVSGSGGVAAVKKAAEIMGFKAGPPRLPIKKLNDKKIKLLKENIENYDF
ncbi:MAG: dihydrodipicolinate synthase family protein [Halanaerobium sp.]